MKQNYITPSLKCTELKPRTVMCTSPYSNGATIGGFSQMEDEDIFGSADE